MPRDSPAGVSSGIRAVKRCREQDNWERVPVKNFSNTCDCFDMDSTSASKQGDLTRA